MYPKPNYPLLVGCVRDTQTPPTKRDKTMQNITDNITVKSINTILDNLTTILNNLNEDGDAMEVAVALDTIKYSDDHISLSGWFKNANSEMNFISQLLGMNDVKGVSVHTTYTLNSKGKASTKDLAIHIHI